jgi:hypothetical protein
MVIIFCFSTMIVSFSSLFIHLSEFIAVLINMFKFGYKFYVVRRNNAIPKQGSSNRNINVKSLYNPITGNY